MFVDPVVAEATLHLRLGPGVRAQLQALAKGHPLLIDFWVSRVRGWRVGDLQVVFAEPAREPRYVRVESIDGREVLVAKALLPVLKGATLQLVGPPFFRHLAIVPAHREEWIDFVERQPRRR